MVLFMQKIITILKVQCVELSEEKLDKKHPVYTASKQTSKIKIVNGEDFDVYGGSLQDLGYFCFCG